MIPNRSTDLGLLSFTYDREMDERGKKWGRKDRRIESQDGEDAGEWWRHKKTNEHKGVKVTSSNQILSKNICFFCLQSCIL